LIYSKLQNDVHHVPRTTSHTATPPSGASLSGQMPLPNLILGLLLNIASILCFLLCFRGKFIFQAATPVNYLNPLISLPKQPSAPCLHSISNPQRRSSLGSQNPLSSRSEIRCSRRRSHIKRRSSKHLRRRRHQPPKHELRYR
jgi:hypothetical protein